MTKRKMGIKEFRFLMLAGTLMTCGFASFITIPVWIIGEIAYIKGDKSES